MPIILETAFLRWYRSFNTQSTERKGNRPWEKIGKATFQFVEVGIDPQITTIVGANESGKSHLLSAISKVFSQQTELRTSDICRHCAYDSLDRTVVPQIGIRLRSGTEDDVPIQRLLKSLDVRTESTPKTLAVILQPDVEPFASLFDGDSLIGTVDKQKWYTGAKACLPEVEIIEPNVKFGSHIHISQLLAAYHEQGEKIPTFFDTMPLNQIGRDILQLEVPVGPSDNEQFDFPQGVCDGVEAAQGSLRHITITSETERVKLERDLFEHILEVPREKLEEIQKMGTESRGYVELLVSDINQRIKQRLDIGHYWSQDEDISLGVNYKDGYFYFEIHDKTGKAFTFDERSSGLQFFLSYYVQSLAIKKRNADRGCIALLDEPDRFLSAIAQRNLLEVFEMLTVAKDGRRLQLIYTTHSPFSINKNFPHRLRLVRKGDGSEGTQLVTTSASRNYEPVRSALGVEAGDTLFYGLNNIIVEGFSDQKAIINGAQLCAVDSSKDKLDLNAVTFLTANGVGKLRRIVERSDDGFVHVCDEVIVANDDNTNSGEIGRLAGRGATSDERKPVTIALIDGDEVGQRTIKEIKSENLLPPNTYSTYSDLKIELKVAEDDAGAHRYAAVLEDLIPVPLLVEGTRQYLQSAWGLSEQKVKNVEKQVKIEKDRNLAETLVHAVRDLEPKAEEASKVHIRGEITDLVFDRLLSMNSFESERELFKQRAERIIKQINKQLQVADRVHRQANIRKHFRCLIDPFFKLHSEEALRFDVHNLLRDLSLVVTGTSPDAKKAREQIAQLEELLDEESVINSDPVDANVWTTRFRELWTCPWAEPKKGWDKVGR